VRTSRFAATTKQEVRAFYEEFLRALKSGDIASLDRIYADDYLLLRRNGGAAIASKKPTYRCQYDAVARAPNLTKTGGDDEHPT
jgi:ketosteroid isomerase-like protein